jgi:hypothetical protein
MTAYWTRDELNRVVLAARRLTSTVEGTPNRLLFEALFPFVADTAIEPYTVLALKSEWMDFREGRLWLPAATANCAHDQEFRLRPDTLARLKNSGAPERERLFPWRIKESHPANSEYFGRSNFHAACHELLAEAGLPPGLAHVARSASRAVKLWCAILAYYDSFFLGTPDTLSEQGSAMH